MHMRKTIEVFRENVETISDELNHYISVGKALSRTKEICDIYEAVKNLNYDSEKPSMHAVILAPSYSGKTQAAFALAHLMNVFFLNFSSSSQTIYSHFSNVSSDFKSCLEKDKKHVSNLQKIDPETRLFTLSLLLIFLSQENASTIEEYFLNYLNCAIPKNTKSLRIEGISMNEFKAKIEERKIDLNSNLVFIDSFTTSYIEIPILINLMKNICCSVHIPIVLSATSPEIYDLVVDPEKNCPKEIPVPWVKIITELPQSKLNFCRMILFKQWDNNDNVFTLNTFYDGESGRINLDELFPVLFDVSKVPSTEMVLLKVIFEFFQDQSETSMPGFQEYLFASLIYILNNLNKSNSIDDGDDGDEKVSKPEPFRATDIWSKFLIRARCFIREGKNHLLQTMDGKMASLHALTPKSENIQLIGKSACLTIKNHFYNFGNGENFDLSLVLGANNEAKFLKDGQDWSPACNFNLLEISNNFFNHFCIKFCKITKFSFNFDYLHAVHKKYVSECISSTISEECSSKLLAHWAIMAASRTYYEPDYFKNVTFLPNLGSLGRLALPECIKNMFDFDMEKLKSTSKSDYMHIGFEVADLYIHKFMHVPYLVNSGDVSDELKAKLEPFMPFGESIMIDSTVIFDVMYKELPNFGLIEPKLRNETDISLKTIYHYYKRSADLKSFYNILLVGAIPSCIEELPAVSCSEEDQEQEQSIPSKKHKKCSSSLKRPIYDCVDQLKGMEPFDLNSQVSASEFKDLWANPLNRIDIYSLSPIWDSSSLMLKSNIIRQFKNPTGIFLIYQNNMNTPNLISQ